MTGRGPDKVEIGDPTEIVEVVRERSAELVARLSELDEAGLRVPSRLAGWDRLTIACISGTAQLRAVR